MAEVQYKVVDHVATLTMSSGKVNALTFELLSELSGVLRGLRDDAERGEIKVLVLRSDRDGFFSPGIDLKQLMLRGPAGFGEFTTVFAEVTRQLIEFPTYAVAAISGHAVAGGLVLALACDERICVDNDKLKVGFTELAVSIPLPATVIELAKHRLRPEVLHEVIFLARVYSPKKAAEVGLLSLVVTETDNEAAVQSRIGDCKRLAGKASRRTTSRLRVPYGGDRRTGPGRRRPRSYR
jgi:enoyl-CoA hydratase